MSSRIYPINDIQQIAISKARIQELDFIISDIYKQRGCINWCLSIDISIIQDFRLEIQKEQKKIDEVINSTANTSG